MGREEMKIKVKQLHPEAKLPRRATEFDAGMDLVAVDFVFIGPGERAIVGTGVAMEIPVGYAGFIWPRSGLAVKKGIDTMAGVVDASYRGEVKVLLLNVGNEAVQIAKGDRIAQLVIQPVSLGDCDEVYHLGESERGAGGFGSTGR